MTSMAAGPLADPIAETRRLIEAAGARGLVLRALGGVAVYLQSDGQPRIARQVKDIDLAAVQGSAKRAAALLADAGYAGDEMFNALRSGRRLLFHDPANGRHVDVFIGQFAMCHDIPLTSRLDREPLTVPREELLLSKLQIVEATQNDLSDVYSLLLRHDVGTAPDAGLDARFLARLCAADWGLWRTCDASIGRLLAGLAASVLDPAEQQVVGDRLERLRAQLLAEPKSLKWRLRSQVGERIRWYQEPEEEQAAGVTRS
jgi:hypothetical protein